MLEKKFVRFLLCLLVALSLSATATMGADILFISSMQEQHMPGDEPLKAFMEGLGHTVTYLAANQDEATTEAAAAAADMVFISESCGSGQIKNEITEVEVPIVVGEPWAWDEMGLTHGGGADEDMVTTDIEIIDPVHYLGADLRGTVAVLTDITSDLGICQLGKGIAGDEATVIATATLADGETYDVIFIYEKGAALPAAPADGSDQIAADIRVCFGFHLYCHPLFNENAYALLEAAINYALGATGPLTQARNPRPRDGAIDVSQDAVLSWAPGTCADKHDVYFGKVLDDVNESSRTNPQDVLVSQNQDDTTYDHPGLFEFGQTYYWRVDEFNDMEPNSPWKGNTWSFTVIDHLIVDDFEDYNDYPPDEIFSTWIDGYGTTTNGSTAGYPEPDFLAGEHYVETTIVHGCDQSMPFFYDNNFKYSEATMTLMQRDWTEEDVGVLSLWFRGDADNAAERMYVSLNGSAVVYHDNPDAALIDTWTEWTIDLQEFSAQGVNLANVNTISIGFGDKNNLQAGGSGLVFFDDIRLYLDGLLPSVITLSPVDTIETTGDNGMVLSINGNNVGDLILGTTTFAGDPKHAAFLPEDADNFDLSVGASADDQAYVQTMFAMPVTTIFIIEKGGNDTGYMQSLDENGEPLDEPTPFLPADFKDTGLTGVQGQKVAAAVIALEVPVYGIRVLPPDDKPLGFDPTSVSGVPAQ